MAEPALGNLSELTLRDNGEQSLPLLGDVSQLAASISQVLGLNSSHVF